MNEENCIFCRIVRKEIPSRIIFENENIIAFLDVNPISEGHSLVIPKKHYATLENVPDSEVSNLFQITKKLADKIFNKLDADGYHILQNNYNAAYQEVDHVHIHIIPRKKGDLRIKLEFPKRGASEEDIDKILKKLKS